MAQEQSPFLDTKRLWRILPGFILVGQLGLAIIYPDAGVLLAPLSALALITLAFRYRLALSLMVLALFIAQGGAFNYAFGVMIEGTYVGGGTEYGLVGNLGWVFVWVVLLLPIIALLRVARNRFKNVNETVELKETATPWLGTALFANRRGAFLILGFSLIVFYFARTGIPYDVWKDNYDTHPVTGPTHKGVHVVAQGILFDQRSVYAEEGILIGYVPDWVSFLGLLIALHAAAGAVTAASRWGLKRPLFTFALITYIGTQLFSKALISLALAGLTSSSSFLDRMLSMLFEVGDFVFYVAVGTLLLLPFGKLLESIWVEMFSRRTGTPPAAPN